MVSVLAICGCKDKAVTTNVTSPQVASQGADTTTGESATAKVDKLDLTVGTGELNLPDYEMNGRKILTSVLSSDQLDEGWVRSFDGHTLAGWIIMGKADWQCKDGIIRVTRRTQLSSHEF